MIEFFRVRSPVSYITAQQQTHITAQQRVQSGLFQPTFFKKLLLVKTRSLPASKKAHDFAEISPKKA